MSLLRAAPGLCPPPTAPRLAVLGAPPPCAPGPPDAPGDPLLSSKRGRRLWVSMVLSTACPVHPSSPAAPAPHTQRPPSWALSLPTKRIQSPRHRPVHVWVSIWLSHCRPHPRPSWTPEGAHRPRDQTQPLTDLRAPSLPDPCLLLPSLPLPQPRPGLRLHHARLSPALPCLQPCHGSLVPLRGKNPTSPPQPSSCPHPCQRVPGHLCSACPLCQGTCLAFSRPSSWVL